MDNPKHERQLDETKRSFAREMGEAFRRLRIPIGASLSSPAYRVLATVKLAELGPASVVTELGDSGQSMMADKIGARGTWLRAKVADLPAPGTITLIVTHLPNISEAYPKEAEGLSDGEALIFRPDGHGAARLVTRFKIDEWAKLDAGHPRQ